MLQPLTHWKRSVHDLLYWPLANGGLELRLQAYNLQFHDVGCVHCGIWVWSTQLSSSCTNEEAVMSTIFFQLWVKFKNEYCNCLAHLHLGCFTDQIRCDSPQIGLDARIRRNLQLYYVQQIRTSWDIIYLCLIIRGYNLVIECTSGQTWLTWWLQPKRFQQSSWSLGSGRIGSAPSHK